MSNDKDTTPVEYRLVTGSKNYRVGSDGSVWSRRARWKQPSWTRLKPKTSRHGYKQFILYVNGKRKWVLVHRAVLMAFIGPPGPKMQCAHANGIKSDNRLENLRWATAVENAEDNRRNGVMQMGERHGRATLTTADVIEIRTMRNNGHKSSDLAKRFKTSVKNINRVVKRKAWAHVK